VKTKSRGDPEDADFFKLMERHLPRAFVWTMRHLPADPRCRLCKAPYGGVGGRVMRRFGYGPSRKNPGLCNTCFEMAPMGGVEMEIGVLFADVRGFTARAHSMAPDDVATLMNRFYGSAARILGRSAIIDKLVGDEVMALYVPQLLSDDFEDDMLRDAVALLESADLGLGVGIDVGRAYVGNVGAGDVKDFTALGDVVNTAARLQSAAQTGQVVMSERLFRRLSRPPASARPEALVLKGKPDPEPARVLELAG
jgi:adenylate cyclase